MNTKAKKYDDNVIRIVVQEVPKTRTLDKVETALSLIDASVKAITDDAIATALDTSSIQTLWSQFEEFDLVTSKALTELDDRIDTLDASLQSLSVDSIAGLSDDISTLNTKTDDISTRLSELVADCSSASRQDIEDVSTRVKTNADAISDVSTRLASNITTLSSNVADNATNIADVSLSTQTNTASISDVSTRFAAHLNDHDSTVADVSVLKTLTANHTTELNGHDASILALSAAVDAANASINLLRNENAATDAKIVIYDTSVRSDISTLESTLTAHLNDFDVSVRNHFVSLDDSVSYLTVERNRLDASITNLTSYIDTTVTQILSTDRARINAIESLAVDTSAYVHDTLLAYGIHLDSSLNQYDSHLDASLNEYDSYINDTLNQFGAHLDASLSQYYVAFDERDVVIARALTQHDASILNLIARVTALENA